MDLFAGLDIGTSKLSAVALDLDGRLSAAASRANDSGVGGLPAGRHEQDPIRIWCLALDVLADLAGRLGEAAATVRAIGLTGQMHGILLADGDLRPVGNLVTWQDARAQEPCPGTDHSVLAEFCARVGEDVLAAAGVGPAAGYGGVTLFWHGLVSGLPDGTQRALLVHDWVAARLAGAEPTTDPTDAASTGMFDVRVGRWHPDICAPLAIWPGLLPRVAEAGAPIGELAADAAAATGLPRDATVHVALGDNQASVLASLAEPATEVLVNMGTGGQVSAVTDRPLAAPGLEMRPFPGGKLLAVGASLCGGGAFRYLARHYALVLRDVGGGDGDARLVMDRLVELARGVPPGADGLVFQPLFMGRRSDPAVRGSLSGMTTANNTPAHWSRALLEGMVAELCDYYREMVRAGLSPRERLVGSGNGMRLNDVLRGAASEAFDMPVAIPSWGEEAACGAALAAMVGSGAVGSFEDAAGLVRYE